jgi:CDP-glycerol glycerophosphotransferase (TagB/SpsB family)
VWGKRVYRQLVEDYGVNASRLRLVGNPLHDSSAQMLLDSMNSSKPQSVLQTLCDRYPHLQKQIETKKIVLLASCLHSEYYGYENEQELYQQYIRHIYRSLDFSQMVLLVKMHPLDKKNPNLYQIAAEELADTSSIAIIEPEVTELDIYKLLLISDLLLTRCSTVAEEALLANKKVVAFDLFPWGPSQGYKHLEEYGSYTTAYAEPQKQLSTAISQALLSPPESTEKQQDHETIVADITYALDGGSTARAVDAILQELNR